jgi:hypothetical protein
MVSQQLRDQIQEAVREGDAKGVIEALAASCKEEGDDDGNNESKTVEDRRDLRELAKELEELAERTYV